MTRARQPEIVHIPQGLPSDEIRDRLNSKGMTLGSAPRAGLNVLYPDKRLLPRICERTRMRRAFCCCHPCRDLRRRKHHAPCRCWLCHADRMGGFIDELGGRTAAGSWNWFVTVTYRTPTFPWANGFPIGQAQPSFDFVCHFFARMIRWIEQEVHARVEFFSVHQFGETGGRLHQHCGLSWPGLFEYRWRDLQEMLWKNAGWNRILPWEQDAGYYIGRYIGRDAERSHWDFSVGHEPVRARVAVGRQVIAASSNLPSSAFRNVLGRWHR
jgi:hypothetical protein